VLRGEGSGVGAINEKGGGRFRGEKMETRAGDGGVYIGRRPGRESSKQRGKARNVESAKKVAF